MLKFKYLSNPELGSRLLWPLDENGKDAQESLDYTISNDGTDILCVHDATFTLIRGLTSPKPIEIFRKKARRDKEIIGLIENQEDITTFFSTVTIMDSSNSYYQQSGVMQAKFDYPVMLEPGEELGITVRCLVGRGKSGTEKYATKVLCRCYNLKDREKFLGLDKERNITINIPKGGGGTGGGGGGR